MTMQCLATWKPLVWVSFPLPFTCWSSFSQSSTNAKSSAFARQKGKWTFYFMYGDLYICIILMIIHFFLVLVLSVSFSLVKFSWHFFSSTTSFFTFIVSFVISSFLPFLPVNSSIFSFLFFFPSYHFLSPKLSLTTLVFTSTFSILSSSPPTFLFCLLIYHLLINPFLLWFLSSLQFIFSLLHHFPILRLHVSLPFCIFTLQILS